MNDDVNIYICPICNGTNTFYTCKFCHGKKYLNWSEIIFGVDIKYARESVLNSLVELLCKQEE